MQDIKEALESATGSVLRDIGDSRDLALEMLLTRFASDLQRSIDRFAHQYIDATWEKFDADKDGSLQPKEMRSVVSCLLADINKNLEQMVRNAMEPATENLHDWIASNHVGPIGMGRNPGGMTIALDANVHKRTEAAAKKLANLLKVLVDGLIRNSDVISDEIFDEVDANKDGKVSKTEFADGFAASIGSVIDFGKITRIILQNRLVRTESAPRPTPVSAPGDDGATVGMTYCVLAIAAACAGVLFLKRAR
jgi:Ca2+-binding EF-hand superfamily protein